MENNSVNKIENDSFTEADLLAASEKETKEIVKETKYDLDSVATLGTSAAVMGKGMFGIFVVIAILIACVYALNAAGKKKKDKNEE